MIIWVWVMHVCMSNCIYVRFIMYMALVYTYLYDLCVLYLFLYAISVAHTRGGAAGGNGGPLQQTT